MEKFPKVHYVASFLGIKWKYTFSFTVEENSSIGFITNDAKSGANQKFSTVELLIACFRCSPMLHSEGWDKIPTGPLPPVPNALDHPSTSTGSDAWWEPEIPRWEMCEMLRRASCSSCSCLEFTRTQIFSDPKWDRSTSRMLQIIHRQWRLVWEPEIPGWEMCEMLRACLVLAHSPVLLLLLCSKCRIPVRCAAHTFNFVRGY